MDAEGQSLATAEAAEVVLGAVLAAAEEAEVVVLAALWCETATLVVALGRTRLFAPRTARRI